MRDTTKKKVPCTDNHWIIGYSKKHPGRIYYYNIITRESKWELNDMEKSKIAANTPSIHLDGCPEPKEPPCKFVNSLSEHICSKNLINNHFPQPYQSGPTFSIPQCNTCSSVNNIAKFDLNIEAPMYTRTPAVWSLPSSHQIVISPATFDLQASSSQNITAPIYTKIQHDILQSKNNLNNSNNFKYRNSFIVKDSQKSKNFRLKYPVNRRQPLFSNNTNIKMTNAQTEINDLRQLLSAKKQICNGPVQNEDKGLINVEVVRKSLKESNDEPQTSCNNTSVKKAVKVDECFSDTDEDWLQENLEGEGTDSRLDVTPLKKLALIDTNPNCWYIVTDAKVLLGHLNFVDILVNSDEKCRLRVPNNVISSLQTSCASNFKHIVRIRHVMYFLKQHLDSSNGDLQDNDVIQLCVKLVQQNYHVVLLLGDEDLKIDKNINRNIHIFTVNEIKKYLKKNPDTLSFKETVVSNDPNVNSPKEHILNLTKIEMQINKRKQTLEAEVQTDLEYINLNDGSNASSGWSSLKNEDANRCDKCTTILTCSNSNKQKREIRLKRNKGLETSIIETNKSAKKKQFQWRKRRENQTSNQSATCIFNKNAVNDNSEQNKQCQVNSINEVNQWNNRSVINSSESSLCNDTVEVQSEFVESIQPSISEVILPTHSGDTNEQEIKSNPSNKNYAKSGPQHVLFEVTGKDMEDYLKLKYDEWVSRFLQIMEEVLTQVLQRAPAFKNDSMPPPWTVHEATECIKKKFAADSDVVDAATKLSDILFKISNDKGKIKANITPSEYMDMFSYGVYLLDSLQSILNDCEDLQTGSESLFRLYGDISNPNVDSSNNILIDSFADKSQESALNVTSMTDMSTHTNEDVLEYDDNVQIKRPKITPQTLKRKQRSQESREAYYLRSSKKETIQANIETQSTGKPVTFIRTINCKNSFFSALLLERNKKEQTDVDTYDANASLNASELDNKRTESQNNIENVTDNDVIDGNCDNNSTEVKISSTPKIIRNFTKCAEFEERLKKRLSKPLDLDELDYDNQDVDDSPFTDEHSSVDGYEGEDAYEDVIINKVLHKCSHENDEQDTNNKKIFKLFIGTILKEINEVFTEVHTFCLKARKELSESTQSNTNTDLLVTAKKSYTVIHNLQESLMRIINREEQEPGAIQNAFKTAGFRNVVLTDKQLQEYRNVLRKSIEQASLLLEATEVIVNAINFVHKNSQDQNHSVSDRSTVLQSS